MRPAPRLLGLCIALVAKVLLALTRRRSSGPKMSGPGIIAFYHGEQLLLLPHRPRDAELYAIVSQSADGDLQRWILRSFSIHSIRGSSSRGGAKALRGALRALRRGALVLISVDGPRGPRGHIHLGALYLAQMSGAPLWAVRARVGRGIRLEKSWDSFLIPSPLTRLDIKNSPALFISREETLASARSRLSTELEQVFREDG